METISTKPKQKPKFGTTGGVAGWFATNVGRILVSIFVPVLTFIVLWQGFLFLREAQVSQITLVIVAIIWGVGGVALLYAASNFMIEQLPKEWTRRLQPFVFVGPALAILAWFLAIPTLRTLFYSFFDANGFNFVGLTNYVYAFTNSIMLEAFRNNLLWMIFGTFFSVAVGLIVAVLADRSRFENIYKAIIFMPMAISFVGASIIWNFVYNYQSGGSAQIGILNAVITAFGGQPVAWLSTPAINNFCLMLVGVWLWAGYCMTILSAAIKGVPAEILEAARVDGANEIQVFINILLPSIMPTIVVVTTSMSIIILKIFDVIYVMTGGYFDTEVIANRMFKLIVTNTGQSTAIAVVLIILTIPIMIFNVQRFRREEAAR